MKYLIIFLLVVISISDLYAQTDDVTLGAQYTQFVQRQRGFYDYSDPETINMRVSVWGFVRYPGRYLVPISTTASDLLTYAGGPRTETDLQDLRLYRVMEDSSQHMFKFTFNDLLWADELEEKERRIPKLQASDLLVVPGAPRLFFQNWFRIGIDFIFTRFSTK